MKFYMAPGSCTTGIHILLEELDLVFEVIIISLPSGEHLREEFTNINPKSSIPVLVTNENLVLTEFSAIAYWLARRYPRANFLPTDIDGEVKVLEVMAYIIDTIHGQGFSRLFVTENYTTNTKEHDSVIHKGHQIINKAFSVIENLFGDNEYIAGKFSIADAALFYVAFWADKLDMDLPPACKAHYVRMLSRPAVQRVLMEEGYHSVIRKYVA